MSRSSDDLRDRYGDILGEDDGFAVLRTVRDLDRAYGEVALHPRLERVPDTQQVRAAGDWRCHQQHGGFPSRRDGPSGRLAATRGGHYRVRPGGSVFSTVTHGAPWRRTGPLLLVAALLLLGVTVVLAAQGIVNLGKPTQTSSTNPYFPLSGFRRVPVSLYQGKKPELLFLAAEGQESGGLNRIAIERWPLVKALEQFGTLSGVKAVAAHCPPPIPGSSSYCDFPTFDLSHAHYASKYLDFVNRDLIRVTPPTAGVYERLTPIEQQIFQRYALPRKPVCYTRDARGNLIANRRGKLKTHRCATFADLVQATIDHTTDLHTLPLIAIGGWLETISQELTSAEFSHSSTVTVSPGVMGSVEMTYPFATVQSALLAGKDPDTGTHLVEDINGEANTITALICHADGGKPDSVCGRPVIKEILTHVK